MNMNRSVVFLLGLWGGLIGFTAAPTAEPRPEESVELHDPPRDAVTFWGHAASYIDLGGTGFVTDPVFEDSYSPFHHRKVPPPPPRAYARTDYILISHAHQDHLSPTTLAGFPRTATILCPEPAYRHVEDLGLPVKVMRPWEVYRFEGGAVVAIPAHHPGGRSSLNAEADGGALGYVIHAPGFTLYYSGDSDYFEGFRLVGERFRPDLVILNVNLHLHSTDAVRAIVDLGTPKVIASHWGAYTGNNAVWTPRWRAELEQILGSVMVPLAVGESLPLYEGLASSPVTVE